MTSGLPHSSPSLLRIIDYAGRGGLGIVEPVRAGRHHTAHVDDTGHEALSARVGLESRHGGQLRSVVVVDHPINFLSNQVRRWSSLPICPPGGIRISLGGLGIAGRLAWLPTREPGSAGAGSYIAAISRGVVVSLLGLHHLVLLIVEPLLLISVGLEWRGVDGSLGNLRKRRASGMLRGIR